MFNARLSSSTVKERKLCVALHAHNATRRDELSFQEDDLIEICESRPDGRLIGKKVFEPEVSGLIAPTSVRIIEPSTRWKSTFCKTLYDYDAKNGDELTFAEDEMIRILKTDCDAGWMSGELVSNKKTGFFPVNFVKFLFDSQANIELLFKEDNPGRFTSNEETEKENIYSGSQLKNPEILFNDGNSYTEELSAKFGKEDREDFYRGAPAVEVQDGGHYYDNNGHVDAHKDSSFTTSTKSLLSETSVAKGDESDEDVPPPTSEAETKDYDVSYNKYDDDALNDKTVAAHNTENEAGNNHGNNFGSQPPSGHEVSKNVETAKNDDEVVEQMRNVALHDTRGFQSSSFSFAPGFMSPLMSQMVINPTIVDYEYHIEQAENPTRPRHTSYTAIVKWSVPNDR